MTTLQIPGPKGENLTFSICPPGTQFREVGGIYAFAGYDVQAGWRVQYIGMTHSLSERHRQHPMWPAAVALGATHVLATVVTLQEDRCAIEEFLIRSYRPPLNSHFTA